MSDTLLARALSSEERWKILNLLLTKQLSESEISEALGISRRLVKSHLTELVNAHLVDAFYKTAPSGKEQVSYRVTSAARSVGFPPRNYEQLSEELITGLVSSLGEKSARLVLRDIGLRLGEKMGKSLLVNSDSTTLGMKEYSNLVVNSFLAGMNTHPHVLSTRKTDIVYEQLNCPFQELADKMPGLVCDALDEAVHGGLDKALNVKTVRLACKGHGDASCKFRVIRLS